jgi:cation transport ATPase
MSDCPSVCPFHMSRSNLRTPWPIHFKFHRVIRIDGLTVCILYGEISNFYSRVMGLYSSNCRRFFVCRAVNWEPLGQFTSSFAQLLKLIVLRSVYFLVKFPFFIQELWERKSTNIVWMLMTGVSCALGAAVYFFIVNPPNRFNYFYWNVFIMLIM